jgi:hypothetical protein
LSLLTAGGLYFAMWQRQAHTADDGDAVVEEREPAAAAELPMP